MSDLVSRLLADEPVPFSQYRVASTTEELLTALSRRGVTTITGTVGDWGFDYRGEWRAGSGEHVVRDEVRRNEHRRTFQAPLVLGMSTSDMIAVTAFNQFESQSADNRAYQLSIRFMYVYGGSRLEHLASVIEDVPTDSDRYHRKMINVLNALNDTEYPVEPASVKFVADREQYRSQQFGDISDNAVVAATNGNNSPAIAGQVVVSPGAATDGGIINIYPNTADSPSNVYRKSIQRLLPHAKGQRLTLLEMLRDSDFGYVSKDQLTRKFDWEEPSKSSVSGLTTGTNKLLQKYDATLHARMKDGGIQLTKVGAQNGDD